MPSENDYLLGYAVETSLLSRARENIFNYKGYAFKFEFPAEKHQGKVLCFVEACGASHLKAHDKVIELLHELLDALAFMTKSSFRAVYPAVILKNETGLEDRVVFRKFAREEMLSLYMTDNIKNAAQDFLTQLQQAPDAELALHWVRYSYRVDSYIDQFFYNWRAFECLLGTTQILRRCENCAELINSCPHCEESIPSSYPGIDKGVAKTTLMHHDSSITDAEFNQIWKMRQRIFHGGQIDNAALAQLITVSPKIGTVVEKMVDRKYQIATRTDASRPGIIRQSIETQSLYKFKTKSPQAKFATDYPTDEQLIDFQNELSAISKDGYELIGYDGQENW